MLSIHKPVFLFDLLGGQCMKGRAFQVLQDCNLQSQAWLVPPWECYWLSSHVAQRWVCSTICLRSDIDLTSTLGEANEPVGVTKTVHSGLQELPIFSKNRLNLYTVVKTKYSWTVNQWIVCSIDSCAPLQCARLQDLLRQSKVQMAWSEATTHSPSDCTTTTTENECRWYVRAQKVRACILIVVWFLFL